MVKAENALLRVKRINGRNGTFCVADLSTDFGRFKVKEAFLDQFEEGEYEVTAWITEIFLGQYIAYGKAVSEVRAQLHDLQVLSEDQRPVPAEAAEVDPLDERAPPPVPEPLPATVAPSGAPTQGGQSGGKPAADTRWDKFKKPAKAAKPKTETESTPQAGSRDDSIYGDEILAAIERREPVKLDATIDRAILREQAAGMKDFGYRFDSRQQTYFPV
jgi:hypothetical protein